jgi:hypothetical protein
MFFYTAGTYPLTNIIFPATINFLIIFLLLQVPTLFAGLRAHSGDAQVCAQGVCTRGVHKGCAQGAGGGLSARAL